MNDRKKISYLTLLKLKKDNQKAVFITAYDYPMAKLADGAGVDMILIGDSLGMTTLGYKNTLNVTMDDMVRHSEAVCRAVDYAFIIGDMPYMSYQISNEEAVRNASRFIRVGCDAVKLEGGARVADRVRAITDAGILVMGHLGLTPQNMAQLGGFRVQGKTGESINKLVRDAQALEKAGAFSILLEGMPREAGQVIHDNVNIPTYGIGAGDGVDGQLLIVHDMIGMFDQFMPKFAKRYCEAGKLIKGAIEQYANEVRSKEFPKEEHFYETKT